MEYVKKGKLRPPSLSENHRRINVLFLFSLSLILFGLLINTPKDIIFGMKKIMFDRDTLITDYLQVANVGSAFVNSGLVTFIAIFILKKLKIHINGVSFAAIFAMAGFSLFGKNIFNIWFIMIGVFLYAKLQKEAFSKYIYIALFGTAMSPIATEFIFSQTLPWYQGIPLGIGLSIFIGFILPPLSTHLLRMHQGYNLYNIGFTAGLISTILVSLMKSYGYQINPRQTSYSGSNLEFSLFLFLVFIIMIGYGLKENKFAFKKYLNFFTYSGRLVTDFIILEGLNLTLINMGLTGIMSTAYVLIVGGNLNGPTMGGIFMIVGFSAFGKHPKNILPIFIGVGLGALTKIYHIDDTTIVLAALFGTALAPIAGEFGFFYGIIAAFIHLSVVVNVFSLHGGLNLYNNGFSAGIVAAFLVPLITTFRRDELR